MRSELIKKYNEYLVKDGAGAMGGYQLLFRFENNYGASCINTTGSYGNEIAVVYFPDKVDYKYKLTYSTSVTDDVLGHLTEDEALKTLEAIKNIKEELNGYKI